MQFLLDDALRGLAGGALIGLSAALLLLGLGRIAGISSIAGGLLASPAGPGAGERAAFLAGLIGAPLAWAAVAPAPAIGIATEPGLLVAAGLLVGIGTRMGSGCTSGHGVCGLSRLSPRSVAATVAFMAVAAGVATILRLAGG